MYKILILKKIYKISILETIQQILIEIRQYFFFKVSLRYSDLDYLIKNLQQLVNNLVAKAKNACASISTPNGSQRTILKPVRILSWTIENSEFN